jgi:hypothetical protein
MTDSDGDLRRKRSQVETSGDKLARLLKLRKSLVSGADSWLRLVIAAR